MTKPYTTLHNNKQITYIPIKQNTNYDNTLHTTKKPTTPPNHATAHKTINIPQTFTLIKNSQDRPYNGDFLEDIRHVKIVQIVMAKADEVKQKKGK